MKMKILKQDSKAGLLACELGSVSLGACEPVSLGFLLGLKFFGPITVD
jgi:hypothetical protein